MAEDSAVATSADGGPFKLEHNPTHGLSITEAHQAGGRRTICMVKDGTRTQILVDLANKAALADGWTPKSLPIGMVEETPAAPASQEAAEPDAAAAGSPAPAASGGNGIPAGRRNRRER